MTADMTARAQAGDDEAFRQLIGPYQGELELHCYRILGSVHDAEDAVQETLLAAWRGLGRFEGRASVRTWLYQVATNCCLKTLRSARRRPRTDGLLPADLPELPAPREPGPPLTPGSAAEQELITRFTRAYQDGDLDAVIALLARDVRLAMPPVPLEYHGRELVAQFLEATAFRARRAYRLIPTRANNQPAFGLYLQDPHTRIARASGLLVLTLVGPQIGAMTRFDNSVLAHFGLPRILPG